MHSQSKASGEECVYGKREPKIEVHDRSLHCRQGGGKVEVKADFSTIPDDQNLLLKFDRKKNWE